MVKLNIFGLLDKLSFHKLEFICAQAVPTLDWDGMVKRYWINFYVRELFRILIEISGDIITIGQSAQLLIWLSRACPPPCYSLDLFALAYV